MPDTIKEKEHKPPGGKRGVELNKQNIDLE